jgi:hypothetical protein
MTYRVDQFAAVHERKEGELCVDWDMVRKFAASGSKEEQRLALALLATGRRVEELEDEISIWRSFMVPEPVVREAAQEPVCASREDIRQAVRDVSREAEPQQYPVGWTLGGTTSEEDADKAVLEAIEKENDRLWR